MFKKDDVITVCKIKLVWEETYKKRRFIGKILKLDENNQYSFTMKKSMPTGCIKKHPSSC